MLADHARLAFRPPEREPRTEVGIPDGQRMIGGTGSLVAEIPKHACARERGEREVLHEPASVRRAKSSERQVVQHAVGHDHEAGAPDLPASRLEQPPIKRRGAGLDVAERRLVGDGAPELPDLAKQSLVVHGQAHDLRTVAVDHPYDRVVSSGQVLEERRAFGQQRLDLRQRHRLDAHKRGLLDALLADAFQEGAVIATGRFDQHARRIRGTFFADVLTLRLGLGQSSPELHLLVDQRPRLSLGERGLIPQEIEKGSGSTSLGEGEGFIRPASLERQPHGPLIDRLLVFEKPAPLPRCAELAADVLDVAGRFACRGERLVGAAERAEHAGQAIVEPHQRVRSIDLLRQGQPLLIERKRLGPVLPRERQVALFQENLAFQLVESAQPGVLHRPVERRPRLGGLTESDLGPAECEQRLGNLASEIVPGRFRRALGETRDPVLEGLRRDAGAGQRRLVVPLGVHHVRKRSGKDTDRGVRAPPGSRLDEREALLENLASASEIAHEPIRRADLSVRHGHR